jgi:hypothetical protein
VRARSSPLCSGSPDQAKQALSRAHLIRAERKPRRDGVFGGGPQALGASALVSRLDVRAESLRALPEGGLGEKGQTGPSRPRAPPPHALTPTSPPPQSPQPTDRGVVPDKVPEGVPRVQGEHMSMLIRRPPTPTTPRRARSRPPTSSIAETTINNNRSAPSASRATPPARPTARAGTTTTTGAWTSARRPSCLRRSSREEETERGRGARAASVPCRPLPKTKTTPPL